MVTRLRWNCDIGFVLWSVETDLTHLKVLCTLYQVNKTLV